MNSGSDRKIAAKLREIFVSGDRVAILIVCLSYTKFELYQAGLMVPGYGAAVVEDAMIRCIGRGRLCNTNHGIGFDRQHTKCLSPEDTRRLGVHMLRMLWKQSQNNRALIVDEELARRALYDRKFYLYALMDGTGMRDPHNLHDLTEVPHLDFIDA